MLEKNQLVLSMFFSNALDPTIYKCFLSAGVVLACCLWPVDLRILFVGVVGFVGFSEEA